MLYDFHTEKSKMEATKKIGKRKTSKMPYKTIGKKSGKETMSIESAANVSLSKFHKVSQNFWSIYAFMRRLLRLYHTTFNTYIIFVLNPNSVHD